MSKFRVLKPQRIRNEACGAGRRTGDLEEQDCTTRSVMEVVILEVCPMD